MSNARPAARRPPDDRATTSPAKRRRLFSRAGPFRTDGARDRDGAGAVRWFRRNSLDNCSAAGSIPARSSPALQSRFPCDRLAPSRLFRHTTAGTAFIERGARRHAGHVHALAARRSSAAARVRAICSRAMGRSNARMSASSKPALRRERVDLAHFREVDPAPERVRLAAVLQREHHRLRHARERRPCGKSHVELLARLAHAPPLHVAGHAQVAAFDDEHVRAAPPRRAG